VSDFARILAIFLLVLGNAVFVAAEYALVTARRARLEPEAAAGSRTARTALELMDHPVRFISTVQVGITLFGIALGAIGQPLLTDYFDPIVSYGIAYAAAFLILTYLSVVLGELVPKAIALQKAEPIAKALAFPLAFLQRVAKPFVWLLQVSSNFVARLFGVQPAPAGELAHSEEEIRHIVAGAEDAGVIEATEEEMLYKVFDFADKEVHEVMVPRPQVVAISIALPAEEALAAVLESPYTRYPVYRDSFDEIAGILHVRDLFQALRDGAPEQVELEGLLRPAYFVPETKDLAALLAEFRRQNQHMAIVVDEYGAMQGIVTLEDLLEEIVGEIEDEFDLPDETVERLDDRTVRIDGTFPIDDFNEQFGTEIPQEDYHTVAGFVFGALGRAAEPGDEVAYDGLHFRVDSVEGQRIDRLVVTFELPQPEEQQAEAAAFDEDESGRA
jgi:putative hemolysin